MQWLKAAVIFAVVLIAVVHIAAVLIAACKDVARLCANALYRDALC